MSKYPKIIKEMLWRVKRRGHSTTSRQYRDIINRFGVWLDSHGGQRIPPEKALEKAQEYLTERAESLSAATVHRDAAALSGGLGVSMRTFTYPRRGEPTKGRSGTLRRPKKAERLLHFAEMVGIRLAEYGRLTPHDFVKRDGRLYVIVRRGKGGKYQEQLILPQYAQEVESFFLSALREGRERLFTKEECAAASRGNTHALRRKVAREAYMYFESLSEEELKAYKEEMERRFKENPKKVKAWKDYQERLRTSPIIYTRGSNRKRLRASGRPETLSRELVMLVSVFCLSHYREDVTITNYII